MSKIKSDIEIARAANIKPIAEVLKKLNVPDDPLAFSPMGRHIAKINLEYLDGLKNNKDGKYAEAKNKIECKKAFQVDWNWKNQAQTRF